MEEKEFETCELLARVEELEDELQAKVQATSLLKENERQLRGQLSEERKHFEDLEEQNAKLKLKFKHLEDRFEENELKLASYTKSESLDSNKVMTSLDSSQQSIDYVDKTPKPSISMKIAFQNFL